MTSLALLAACIRSDQVPAHLVGFGLLAVIVAGLVFYAPVLFRRRK